MQRIYLDYNASTPIAPAVQQVIMQHMAEELGNPSSVHLHGKLCRRQLEESRQSIAQFFDVKPQEVFFTSGATEGAVTLLRGIMQKKGAGHIISSKGEHACVYQTLQELSQQNIEVTFLPIDAWGAPLPEAVKAAIRPDTKLITITAVNHETGVKTDVEAIAAIAQSKNIPFVVDGTAWIGKEVITLPKGVSALFFSGHKIYAPKGIGCYICRSNLKYNPLWIGGGQEFNRRGGTENLLGIIALAKAICILKNEQAQMIIHMQAMRDLLERELKQRLPNVSVNGAGPRICNTSNLAFGGVDGESLLIGLDAAGISVSHGSACAAGALEPSRVLLAMGLPQALVRSSLRFSLGHMTTEKDIMEAIDRVVAVVHKLQF